MSIERLCTCGHDDHWHGDLPGAPGAGQCEHDNECCCIAFAPSPWAARSAQQLSLLPGLSEYEADRQADALLDYGRELDVDEDAA